MSLQRSDRIPSYLLSTALLCVAVDANAQQSVIFAQDWGDIDGEFGALAIEYRLTDSCDIDPTFEVLEGPKIDLTNEQIFHELSAYLSQGTHEQISDEAVVAASLQVFGQETIPDRTLEIFEFDALVEAVDRFGPWPVVRTAPIGANTYRCTFDEYGILVKVEKLVGVEEGYSEIANKLSEEGPFRIRWRVGD